MLGRRHRSPRLDDASLATCWQVVSLLLDYPTEELLGRRPMLESAVATLPRPVRDPLGRFLATLGSRALGDFAA